MEFLSSDESTRLYLWNLLTAAAVPEIFVFLESSCTAAVPEIFVFFLGLGQINDVCQLIQ